MSKIGDFFATNYPGVDVKEIEAQTPDHLEAILAFYHANGRWPEPGEVPGDGPAFLYWPTAIKNVTQVFGNDPAYYQQFGLPGHEGIDLAAPLNTPYFAAAGGTITKVGDKRDNGEPSPYGWHCIIDHGNWTTLYAHARSDIVDILHVGKKVSPGDTIAYSGNSGNSRGPHLHFTLKIAGYVAPGWECCPGYADPWPYLQHLYARAPQPPLVAGWVWTSFTEILHGGLIRATGNLKLRSGPSQDYSSMGVWQANSVAYDEGMRQNSYVYIRAAQSDVAGYPPPTGSALLGLHASATSVLAPGELQAFATAKVETVKVLSSMNPEHVSALVNQFPHAPFVVRAFLSMQNRLISPEQFVNDTLGDVRRTIGRIREWSTKTIWIELHNEPNLFAEGLASINCNITGSWGNASGFNIWYLDVLNRYRQAIADGNVKFLFPGLSPGGDVACIRKDSNAFLDGCGQAIAASDGLAVHVYWSHPDYPMAGAISEVDSYIARYPNAPIWITECSNNQGPHPGQKGQEYIEFHRQMRLRPAVMGIHYFVASSASGVFENEVWVRNGQSLGIAESVGSRE